MSKFCLPNEIKSSQRTETSLILPLNLFTTCKKIHVGGRRARGRIWSLKSTGVGKSATAEGVGLRRASGMGPEFKIKSWSDTAHKRGGCGWTRAELAASCGVSAEPQAKPCSCLIFSAALQGGVGSPSAQLREARLRELTQLLPEVTDSQVAELASRPRPAWLGTSGLARSPSARAPAEPSLPATQSAEGRCQCPGQPRPCFPQ